jgi:hypothetical protein
VNKKQKGRKKINETHRMIEKEKLKTENKKRRANETERKEINRI